MTHKTTAKKSEEKKILRKWFTVAYHKFPTCTRKNTLAHTMLSCLFLINM